MPARFGTTAASLYVGYSGAGNSLVISNGGVVNSYGSDNYNGSGYIGYTNSNNNSVRVTDTGSVWNVSGDLYVGSAGVGNSLMISNGGQVVVSGYGYVGSGSGGSNNSVLVTGSNSVWNIAGLVVGISGAGSSMVINNGGQVVSYDGYVGSGGSNNSVLVTGSNSVWNIAGLYVGSSGAGNSLVISNGGKVVNDYGLAGFGYVGYEGSSNCVLVTDTGSVWNVRGELYVGYSGAGNSLVISNSGQVVNGGGYVGDNSSSSNSSVLVTGLGSVWSNSSYLYVGYSGAGNSLVISNGGKVNNDFGIVGFDSGSSNNSVLVTGSNSVWNISGDLDLGSCGASNRLTVAGGGVLASNMFVTYYSFNNLARVDSGSVIVTNALGNGSLVVGRAGGKAELILNGGTVTVDALIATNPNSVVQFNGGVLNSAGTSVTNGQTFFVGNGTNVAKFHLLGGVHSFAGEGGCGGGGVRVDIYSGFNTSGGGAPYSGLAGSFYSTGVSFATDNGYSWHPFCLSEFGADITGSLSVASTGSYTFSLNSDDGSLLFIDGSLVVTNGGPHTPQVASGSATLTAGIHPFEVQFFECCGGPSGVNLILPAGVSYVQTNSICLGLGLRIRANALLSGCGTINGSVLVDSNALVLANCGGTLTFTGILTNNGTMRAVTGSVLEFYGPVVNNGIIDIMDGTTNFHSSFVNNGTVVDASYFRVVSITRQADDINIAWTTVGGDSYVVQVTAGAADGSYSNNFTDLSLAIAVPGSGLGTTNYLDVGGAKNMPARYYRIQLSSPMPVDP